MRHLHSFLLLPATLMILSSCDNSDEPEQTPEPAKHISSIISDNESQEYSYYENGRAKTWSYSYHSTQSSSDYTAEYDYPSTGIINIKATEKVLFAYTNQTDEFIYDELLHLSPAGTALYCEGTWTYLNNSSFRMKKKYRCDYNYDASEQLTSIEVSEWIIDHDDNVLSKTPWIYEYKLYWNNGNIENFIDSQDNTVEYTYMSGTTAADSPVVFPVIRSYYMPLNYSGIFGKRPLELVSKTTTLWHDGAKSAIKYSYTFGISTSESRIEAYGTSVNNGPETEYIVTWTK